MCKYCDELFTNACTDDILKAPIKVGEVEVGSITVYLTETVTHVGRAHTEDVAVMKLFAEVGDTPIINKYIQIKYCPFCGKELKPKKSINERFNRIWD